MASQNESSGLDGPAGSAEIKQNNGSHAEAESSQAAAEAGNKPDDSSKKCAKCGKEEDPEKPFKDCPKCHSVQYCSRDCQKDDFKQHKKICAALAQAFVQTHAPARQASRAPPKPSGNSRGLQKWQFDT